MKLHNTSRGCPRELLSKQCACTAMRKLRNSLTLVACTLAHFEHLDSYLSPQEELRRILMTARDALTFERR